MSARSVFTLLVAVLLGLLLFSATALSRSEVEKFRPTSGWVDGDDGPDDGPEDISSGDDDNWDKPAVPDRPTVQVLGADGPCGTLGPEPPGEKPSRLPSTLRLRLRFVLHAWAIFFGVR
jgi:hypothetical protein